MRGSDRRSPEAAEYRKLYKTARWLRTRAKQLADEPLCRMCKARGRITAATVCDHVDPKTKQDPATFFDGPFQSLCDDPRYRCHSRWKQQQEGRGYSMEIGEAGIPLDPDHPFNR
jgi:hypothetical protein